MTLLIGAANSSYAFLASDRRLSWNGQLVDDEANKATILATRDARVAMAFTGLAKCEGFLAEDWLLEVLYEGSKQTNEILPLLDFLAARANQDIPNLTVVEPQHRRLAILIVGFTYWTENPEPAGWLLTNLPSDMAGCGFSRFSLGKSGSENSPVLVRFAGSTGSISDRDNTVLRAMLSNRRSREAIEGKLADMLCVASKHPRSQGSVGAQGNICLIPATPNENMQSTYYASASSWQVFGANSVFAVTGKGAMLVAAGTLLVGNFFPPPNIPQVKPNRPCPCGSGVKYKRCHQGLKYGYLPLTAMIELQKGILPSGHRFAVNSRGTASRPG
ncbi:MAG: hypothetical protein CVV27_03875 [Candidatus Melainabacteria bacterium HGW-Melainabacteria-1]|nr:MAG: hypothetical protein CVV27_03875 [Candidatus Melainabacteria bacterium HGW-Melainabacteria-1]